MRGKKRMVFHNESSSIEIVNNTNDVIYKRKLSGNRDFFPVSISKMWMDRENKFLQIETPDQKSLDFYYDELLIEYDTII
jgi:hypothetical protein